jgi:NADH:quinone reductase (non-electrogenic)
VCAQAVTLGANSGNVRAARTRSVPNADDAAVVDKPSEARPLVSIAPPQSPSTVPRRRRRRRDNVKQALVAANELHTRLIMRPLRNTERVLTNAAVEEILAIEREKGAATTIEDIRHLVGGAGNRRVLQEGELDAGAWSSGTGRGV